MVSTSMQVDGYSLEAQEERIKHYAKAYDIEIIQTYKDAGKSGTSISGRNEFIAMLNDIEAEKDKVDYVMVFNYQDLEEMQRMYCSHYKSWKIIM